MKPAWPLRALLAALAALACALAPGAPAADPWPNIPIPPENARALTRPPRRPPAGDAPERAAHLARALETGDVDPALDFFLPREPFLAIKDMSGAARYYATLIEWYRRDVAAMRAELPRAVPVAFVRFEPGAACAWRAPGSEYNRLPYWSCYGSRLVVSAGGREHRLRVHVIINWGQRWYVTHLRPVARR